MKTRICVHFTRQIFTWKTFALSGMHCRSISHIQMHWEKKYNNLGTSTADIRCMECLGDDIGCTEGVAFIKTLCIFPMHGIKLVD